MSAALPLVDLELPLVNLEPELERDLSADWLEFTPAERAEISRELDAEYTTPLCEHCGFRVCLDDLIKGVCCDCRMLVAHDQATAEYWRDGGTNDAPTRFAYPHLTD